MASIRVARLQVEAVAYTAPPAGSAKVRIARLQADAQLFTSGGGTTTVTIVDTIGIADQNAPQGIGYQLDLADTIGMRDEVVAVVYQQQQPSTRRIWFNGRWITPVRRIRQGIDWATNLTRTSPYVLPPLDAITLWGSSSAEGVNAAGRGVGYWLGEDFPFAVTNAAIRGEWDTHAAAWSNAIKVQLTLAGGQIPATATPVTVSAHTFGTTTGNALSVRPGTLAGIAGILTYSGSTWSFTRSVPGAAVAVPAGSEFTSAVGSAHRADTQIMWTLKNTLTSLTGTDVTAPLGRLATMVKYVSSTPRRVLVPGYWNNQMAGNPTAGASGDERTRINAANTALAATYGQVFVDVAGYLASPRVWADTGIVPTAADLAAQAGGDASLSWLPPSLSSDFQHLNEAGYRAVAQLIADQLVLLGWYQVPALPAPVVELDGDNLPGVDGAAVTSWPSTGTRTAAATATTGQAPTKRTNVVGGHATARFSGAQRMTTGAWPAAQPVPLTAVVLWRRDAPVTGNAFTGIGSRYAYAGASGAALVAGAGAPTQMTWTPPTEGWFFEVVVFDGADTRLYVNSTVPVLLGTTGTDPATAGLPGLTLGSNAGGTTSFLTGDIAVARVYPGALSPSQVARIVRDGQARYGLSIPTAPTVPAPAGPLKFGTLQTSSNRATNYDVGMVELRWDYWQPTAVAGVGQRNTSTANYVPNMVANIKALLDAGIDVTLGLGLHLPPAWVAATFGSDVLYKNDSGAESTAAFIGSNWAVIDFTLSATARRLAQEYIADVKDALDKLIGPGTFNRLHAIRDAVSGTGEQMYPQRTAAAGQPKYAWWGFSSRAQGGPGLAAGMTAAPTLGTPTGAQVGPWITWHQECRSKTALWFIGYVCGTLNFPGFIAEVTPGSGVRPAAWTTLLGATTLPGPASNNGAGPLAGVGAVWHKFYGDLDASVWAGRVLMHCSSLADGSGGDVPPQPADDTVALLSSAADSWGSARWFHFLAGKFPRLAGLTGENPGGGGDYGPQMMTDAFVILAAGPRWREFYWAHEAKLYDGTVPVQSYYDAISNYRNPPAATGYLTRAGSVLHEPDGSVWRGAGVNWHWAGLRESNLTYPTHAQIDEVFAEVVAQGATWVRAHTLGISAGLAKSLVTGINPDGTLVWNAAAWEPIDYAISRASALGIRLSIPFTDQHGYYHLGKAWWVQQAFLQQATSGIPSSYTYVGAPGGTETGVTSYSYNLGGFSGTARRKKIEQQFYALPWLRTAFLTNYVGAWLDHVNQFTGVANKNEPMVAFLSAGNELWDSGTAYADHAGADGVTFAAAFSALVKSKQPGVMVVDPMGSYGGDPSQAPGATDANTDIIDVDHIYTGGTAPASGYVTAKIAKATALGKVAVFGEYAFTNPGISQILAEIEQAAGCMGDAYWAIYSSSEGHTSAIADDSAFVIGGNAGWRAKVQAHAAVLSSGTVPTPPVLTNLLRSAAAANSDTAVSVYAAGATDTVPTLAAAAGAGVSGGAVQATSSGGGHKWVFITDTAAAAPVTPGQTYTATAHARLVSGTLGTGFYGHLTWLRTDGSYLSGATSSGTVTAAGSYQQVTFTGVAPAAAAFAVPQVEFDGPATGTAVVLIDQWGVFAGPTASPWVPPVSLAQRPTTDLPGWKLAFTDDMDYDIAEGAVTPNSQGVLTTGAAAPIIGSRFTFYPDGWDTSHGGDIENKTPGEPGYIAPGQPGYPAQWPAINSKYMPSKVVSFANGSARFRLRSELVGGVMTFLGSTMKPILGPPATDYRIGPYARWRFRWRASQVIVDGVDRSAAGDFTSGTDNRIHALTLGIDSNTWQQRHEELDWFEGSLNRRIRGNYHPLSASNETYPITTPSPLSHYEWRVGEVIWEPGKATFLVDGVVAQVFTDRVPDSALAILVQIEADYRQPPADASALLEIDWITIWRYDPTTL